METAVYQRIGRQIRTAREGVHLSQEELAQRLGYRSPTAVSYFESGLRKVSVYDLQRIADILGRPLSFFLGDAASPEETSLVRLRAQSVEPSARQTVDAFVAFVMRRGGTSPACLPTQARGDPESAANYILTLAGVVKPPVPVYQVAEQLHIPVFEWDFPDEISGAFVYLQETAAIAINQDHPGTRQRFTVGHELGHFVFSADQGLFVDLLSREGMPALEESSDPREERNANWFAADLLMPAKWVRRDVREHGVNLALLSQQYDVSEQALWFRIQALHLADEGHIGRSG